MGMALELANEGDVFMMCQGSGGGYGDVLERDPAEVMADIEDGLISVATARDIYFCVFDADTLAVAEKATAEAREAERRARLDRGRPYGEFIEDWVTEGPPEGIPYYGSWGDDATVIHAVAWAASGPIKLAVPMAFMPPIMLPDPKDLAILGLQAEVAALKASGAASDA
jgi:hypothetical protein